MWPRPLRIDIHLARRFLEVVVETLWEIQKLIRDGATLYGGDVGAPYAPKAGANYLQMYQNATRTSTKREQAVGHCRAMQS